MRLPVVVPHQVEFLGARAPNETRNSRSKMLAEKLRGQDRRDPSLRTERRRSTLRRRSTGVPRRPAWLRPLLCTYSFATLRSLILRDADANNGGFPLLRVLTSLTVQTNSPYSIVYTSLLIVDRRISGPTVGTPYSPFRDIRQHQPRFDQREHTVYTSVYIRTPVGLLPHNANCQRILENVRSNGPPSTSSVHSAVSPTSGSRTLYHKCITRLRLSNVRKCPEMSGEIAPSTSPWIHDDPRSHYAIHSTPLSPCHKSVRVLPESRSSTTVHLQLPPGGRVTPLPTSPRGRDTERGILPTPQAKTLTNLQNSPNHRKKCPRMSGNVRLTAEEGPLL